MGKPQLESVDFLLDIFLIDPDPHELLTITDPVESLLFDFFNLGFEGIHSGRKFCVELVNPQVDFSVIFRNLDWVNGS